MTPVGGKRPPYCSIVAPNRDSPPAGLRPYEFTTATASISIMKSGLAPTVVLVGVATPK